MSAEEYLQNAESHAEFPFRWVWEFYPTAFDSDAAELTERERQFVSELKELDADDRTICSMTLEFLGLEGQFLITQRGNAYFEWMGYDGLFENCKRWKAKQQSDWTERNKLTLKNGKKVLPVFCRVLGESVVAAVLLRFDLRLGTEVGFPRRNSHVD